MVTAWLHGTVEPVHAMSVMTHDPCHRLLRYLPASLHAVVIRLCMAPACNSRLWTLYQYITICMVPCPGQIRALRYILPHEPPLHSMSIMHARPNLTVSMCPCDGMHAIAPISPCDDLVTACMSPCHCILPSHVVRCCDTCTQQSLWCAVAVCLQSGRGWDRPLTQAAHDSCCGG